MTPQKSPDGRDIDADGWIAWEGGDCPVAAETIVEVQVVDGTPDKPKAAQHWCWEHVGCDSDITHYRLVPAPAAVEHVERGEVDAEYVKRLEAYALEITRALTGLVGGGSEMFGRKLGEMYTADTEYCVRLLRERNTRANERYIAAVRAQREAGQALRARTVTRTGE